MGRLTMGVVAILVAGCSGEPPAESGGADTQIPVPGVQAAAAVQVGDSAVGCVEIGVSLDSVKTGCRQTWDTTIYLEGRPQQAVWVDVGVARVLAEVVDNVVWRIRVRDPSLETNDSIRVGMPVSRVAELPGIRILYGEGTFATVQAHCGMSFELRGLPYRSGGWTAEELSALPERVSVATILVLGRCHGH